MSARGVRVRLPARDGGDPRELAAPTAQELQALAVRQHGAPGASLAPSGGLVACVACGHPELFTRKDFPRAAGLAIVAVAAVLAPATRYASLLAAAALDLALYRVAPSVVQCYVCACEHRGFPPEPRHPSFDREIDERLRYGARAVMGKPMRPGGTAGAPDPEH